MAFHVYVLWSESAKRHYCGQTSDLEQRIRQHNEPGYRLSRTTKRLSGPWKLVWSQQVASRSQAIALERKIKSRGIKRFLASHPPA